MKKIIIWLTLLSFMGTYSMANKVYKDYYDSGELKEVTKSDGDLTETTTYDISGTVREITHYKNTLIEEGFRKDLLNGSTKFFYKSGMLMLSEVWKENSPRGVSKLYFESGKLQMSIHFDDTSGEALHAYIYKEDGRKKKVSEKEKLSMIMDWFYEKRLAFKDTLED